MATTTQTTAAAIVVTLLLTGCSSLGLNNSGTTLTGLAACAAGHTWNADLADMSAQLLAEIQEDHPDVTAVTAEGSQTIDWATDGAAVLTTDYALTVTVAVSEGVVQTIVQERSGESTGVLTIHGDTLVPSDWDESDYKRATTIDGAEAEGPPFTIPDPVLNDVVASDLTCDGKTMTTHAHRGIVTQKWTRP